MSSFTFPSRSGRDVSATGPHAWEGGRRGWEATLVASLLLPVFFIAVGERTPATKIVIISLLLAILPLYVFVGRPVISMEEDQPRGVVYVALLVVLFVPAVLIEPSTTFCLFGLCPQCFMVLTAKRAMIGVFALTLAPGIRFIVSERNLDGAFHFLTVAMITVFFSAAFGFWMEGIAQQSIERADLIKELESTQAEVALLSAERGALAERERLAGEIHDTLAQGFTSIIMLIQAAEAQPDPARHLALAVQTARENLAESRALVAALSPAPLDGSSLVEALRRITSRLGEEVGIGAEFGVTGDSHQVPPQYEVVLIRSAQEGLNNVRRHADASHVRVSLEYGEGEVTLRVRDDGRGFSTGSPSGGYGLRAMRNRVEQAGGTVTLESTAGTGTELIVRLPEEAR